MRLVVANQSLAPSRQALWERIRPQVTEGPALRELGDLFQEKDPELFQRALLTFAIRQEQAERLPLAAELYAALASSAEARGETARRARERLEVLQGGGPFGLRYETIARRFSREACDPAALAAMGFAGVASRLARVGVLSRLFASPAAHPLTRGFGARALAGMAGFALEVPVFTLSARLGHAAMGQRLDWSDSALRRDLASSFLFLGGLKLGASASGGLARAWELRGPAATALVHGGAWGGILFGQGLEEWAGLREPRGLEASLLDSLLLLGQFHVAANLSKGLFGGRLQAWEARLDAAAERLGQGGPTLFPPRELSLAAGPAIPRPPLVDSPAAEVLFAMGRDEGGASGRRPRGNPLAATVAALRGLRVLPRHHVPYEEVTFLLRLAKKLETADLKENAYLVLEKARELAKKLEYPNHAAEALGQVGEAMAGLGRQEVARSVFSEARGKIAQSDRGFEPHLMGSLWRRQKRAGDLDAPDTLRGALQAAAREGSANHPWNSETLALHVIAEGSLSRARDLIDELPKGYRAFALSDLASQWAKAGPEHQTVARAIFLEARAEIDRGASVRERNYPAYALARLAKQMLEAGEDFREDAYEVTLELRRYIDQHISDPVNLAHQQVELIKLTAKARHFREALSLLRMESRDPALRSEALGTILMEMGRAGRIAEAELLLRSERMQASERFMVLVGLASLLRQERGEWSATARGLLREARELILLHEFPRGLPSRDQGLIRLAGLFVEAGDRAAGEALYEEARQAIETDIMIVAEARPGRIAELALERAARLAFAKVPKDHPAAVEDIRRAALQGEVERVARRATLLGFSQAGFAWALEHLSDLPESYRLWARVHLYEGASLLPRDATGRASLARGVAEILRMNYTSESPLAARVHRRAAQLLQSLDSGAWLRVAHDRLREVLGLQATGIQAFVWGLDGDKISFPVEDEILYQTLFYLANSRHAPSQDLVRDLSRLSNFPEAWRPVLERALRSAQPLVRPETGKALN